jgi:hypothetical protein
LPLIRVVDGAEKPIGSVRVQHPAIRIALMVATAALTSAAVAAQYDVRLQYQRRGDREEGLRSIAVGGRDIDLVSARIDGPRNPSSALPPSAGPAWGESVKARFFLPESSGVYLTVRQLRSQSTYYWLTFPARDEPDPSSGWSISATNEYAWPTSTVLARLRGVTLDDLGAVVRLGQPAATNVQRVLPVALFDRDAITVVDAYRFSWRPLNRVNVTVEIRSVGGDLKRKPYYTRAGRWEDAGSPFTVVWSPADAPEGWYRAILSGYFDNNARLDREVVFYHRPILSNTIRRAAP